MDFATLSIIITSASVGAWFGWSVRSDTNWKAISLDIEENFKKFKKDTEASFRKVGDSIGVFGEKEQTLTQELEAVNKKIDEIIEAKRVYAKAKSIEAQTDKKQEELRALEAQLNHVVGSAPESDEEEEKPTEYKGWEPTPEQDIQLEQEFEDLKSTEVDKVFSKKKALEALRNKSRDKS